jgi:hypothetical protein
MVVRMGGKTKVILIESSQFSAVCPSDRNDIEINTLELWDAVAWMCLGRSLYFSVFHKYLNFFRNFKGFISEMSTGKFLKFFFFSRKHEWLPIFHSI